MLLYFWRDIVRIVAQWFRALFGRIPRNDPDARMGWLVIIGSIPIVVLGLLFQDQIETDLPFALDRRDDAHRLRHPARHRRLRSARRPGGCKDLTWGHGIIFGFAQALALIPGVSRSGGTITAGLFMGYQRRAAARYSFLLALPAVFGSGFYQLYKAIKEPCTQALASATPARPRSSARSRPPRRPSSPSSSASW